MDLHVCVLFYFFSFYFVIFINVFWNEKGLKPKCKQKKIMYILKSKQYSNYEGNTFISIKSQGHYAEIGLARSTAVLVIMLINELQFKCINVSKDTKATMIVILAEIQSRLIVLANIYVPNGE